MSSPAARAPAHGKRDIRHAWTACIGVLPWPHKRSARTHARTHARSAMRGGVRVSPDVRLCSMRCCCRLCCRMCIKKEGTQVSHGEILTCTVGPLGHLACSTCSTCTGGEGRTCHERPSQLGILLGVSHFKTDMKPYRPTTLRNKHPDSGSERRGIVVRRWRRRLQLAMVKRTPPLPTH